MTENINFSELKEKSILSHFSVKKLNNADSSNFLKIVPEEICLHSKKDFIILRH